MLQNQCRFFLMLLLLTSGLTACATYMSMEIFIDNGDAVKIGLDIVDGERLSFEDIENNSFSIRKGETELMSGLFFVNGEFDEYIAKALSYEGVFLIEATPEHDPSFYCFEFPGESGTEYGFLRKIEGCGLSSVVLFSNDLPYQEANAIFQRLHFDKID